MSHGGLALAALLLAVLFAGCVGPTGADTCPVPGAQGTIPLLLATSNGTRDVPKSSDDRWVVIVTCDEGTRGLDDVTLTVVTPEHGDLVAAPQETFGGVLSLYAEIRPGDPEDAELEADLPPPGRNPAYRLRIHNDGRDDRGLDKGDWFELAFDADGDRDFREPLTVGDHRFQVRDAATGTGIGLVVHRIYRDF